MNKLFISIIVCFMFLQKPIYQIVKTEKDSKGYINTLLVFTKKESNIKSINSELLKKYQSPQAVTFQIFYFDNLNVARNYEKVLFNKNISDDVIERMSDHVIGKYVYNRYLNQNGQLYTGKNSDLN